MNCQTVGTFSNILLLQHFFSDPSFWPAGKDTCKVFSSEQWLSDKCHLADNLIDENTASDSGNDE